MVLKTENKLPESTKSSLREALPQVLAVGVKNVLLLGFGMTLGFPTILIPSLQGTHENESISLGPDAISWIGSINLICVPVGCLLSGAITQPIGRKRAMQLVNIPFLTAWLLFHFSTEAWQIFVALALTGLSGGLLEAPVLTYVAEITTPKLRGILASTSTVAIISGTLMQFLLGTFLHWRTVALVSCSAPIISFILYFFVPESPHWLISKDRLKDAQESIAWLRGWKEIHEIDDEFKELYNQLKKNNNTDEKASKIRSLKLFTKKNFYWPFSLVCYAFFLGHFMGMSTLQTYAVKIFATLKSPIDKYYATIFLGVAQLLGCLVSVALIHKVGKRKLNLFSLIGSGLGFVIVATYAYLIGVFYMDQESVDSNSPLADQTWIPLTFLISAAFFCHTGIRILPWMLIGEVYPPETRSMASGMTGATSYFFGFAANKLFLSMVGIMTVPGTFWFYGCMALTGAITLHFALPETEGKTLYEITEHFAGRKKMNNKIFKEQKVHKIGAVNEAYRPDKYEQFESSL